MHTSSHFPGRDGAELAFHETGAGRPLIMLHGFMGRGAQMLELGLVTAPAAHGYRVVLPDLRGHGGSAAPRDPGAYPPDVLADDGIALIEHLGLAAGEYDLGGYSLGARVTVRMLARGAGQGLAKVSGPQRGETTRGLLTALAEGRELEPGSRDARMAQWFIQSGADPRALLNVLDSLVPTPEDALRRITVPALVAIGDRDERSDADELAALLPSARFLRVPGDHGSALAAPELAEAVLAFLTER